MLPRYWILHLLLCHFAIVNPTLAGQCSLPTLTITQSNSRLFNIPIGDYLIDTISCLSLTELQENLKYSSCSPCYFQMRVNRMDNGNLSFNFGNINYVVFKRAGEVIAPIHQNAERALYSIPNVESSLDFEVILHSEKLSDIDVTHLSDDTVMREQFLLDSNTYQTWNAIAWSFLGGLLFIFLVNVISFFFNRRKEILYYGLYAFSLFVYFFVKTISSYNAESQLDLNLIELLLQPIFLIAYVQFVRSFIESRERFARIDLLLRLYLTMLFLALILMGTFSLLDMAVASQVVWYSYRTLAIVSAVGIIVYFSFFKDNLIRFIVVGSSCLVIGGTMAMVFSIFKIYLGAIAPIHWMIIGIVLELIIFSGGVGYRMWLNNQERLQYQSALISEMKKTEQLSEIREEELNRQVTLAVQKLREEEHQKIAVELSLKQRDTELQLLRAQMNPHFIFNCLNSVKSFIAKNEPRAAGDYLSKFAHLMRMILANSKRNTVTLATELETIETYIKLEQMRFNHSFSYNIEVEEDIQTENIQVLPLILQPYVENAIWHGLLQKEGNGKIEIRISLEANHLLIEIEDNGIGRQASAEFKMNNGSKKHKSYGTAISKDRLLQYYRESFEVLFVDKHEAGEPAGTIVKLQLPINTTIYAKAESDPY